MMCVVVGAGPGLGGALARRFAAGGLDVALIARSAARVDGLREGLATDFPTSRFTAFAADASRADELRSALNQAQNWGGDLDVLIYNAALMKPDATFPTAEALEEHMRTTVGGAITSVNAVLPAMRRNQRGTILVTGGGLALEPYPQWATLGAGKAALRSLTLSWHKALKPEGIRVASIAVCGAVESGGLFDPDLVAEQYWALHQQSVRHGQRELVYLPEGADPYYNDPHATYRAASSPIEPTCREKAN